MRRFFWIAVGLVWGFSACLSSGSSVGSGTGSNIANPVENRSGPPPVDVVEDNAKPHPTGVAAPTPDFEAVSEDSAEGTQSVFCSSTNPASVSMSLKGQLMKGLIGGGNEPCHICKYLRILIDEPGEDRFVNVTVKEGGYFEVVLTAPTADSLSFYVMPGMDAYGLSLNKTCPDGACVSGGLTFRNLLTQEFVSDPLPDCDSKPQIIIKLPKKLTPLW